MVGAIRPLSCVLQVGRRHELANRDLALMAGTVRRGGQIAWAGLKLGVAVLRLRRRAPDLLPAYVSTTLVGLGTTFVKLGQGLSLRWDLLPVPYREALSRLHSDVPAFPADQARRMVEQAFGAPVGELFASFDDKPLAAASVDNGITHAVLTPHIHPGYFDNSLSTLQPVFDDYRASLAAAGIQLTIARTEASRAAGAGSRTARRSDWRAVSKSRRPSASNTGTAAAKRGAAPAARSARMMRDPRTKKIDRPSRLHRGRVPPANDTRTLAPPPVRPT